MDLMDFITINYFVLFNTIFYLQYLNVFEIFI